MLAIAEPFLYYLIPANRVIPNARGNVFPVGHVVQIYVVRLLTKIFKRIVGAGARPRTPYVEESVVMAQLALCRIA